MEGSGAGADTAGGEGSAGLSLGVGSEPFRPQVFHRTPAPGSYHRLVSLLAVIPLFLGSAQADEEACRQPLAVRLTLPAAGSADVPVDARVLVGFIGWGEADEFSVDLIGAAAPVPVEAESWCYLHEGPHERHCWWSLRPTERLAVDTEYRIRVRSTEAHTGPDHESIHRFTTGSGTSLPPPEAPTGEIGEAWDEESGEACDFPFARRTLMRIEAGDALEEGLGVFHLFEVVAGSETEPLVHTIRTQFDEGGVDTAPRIEWNVKQYVDGTTAPTDCFRVVAENAAGEAGASTVLCYGDADTGTPDSGPSGADSGRGGAGDSGAGDSGSGDSGARDDPHDVPTRGDRSTTAPVEARGCGRGAAGLLLIGGALARRRRNRTA